MNLKSFGMNLSLGYVFMSYIFCHKSDNSITLLFTNVIYTDFLMTPKLFINSNVEQLFLNGFLLICFIFLKLLVQKFD